MTAPRLAIRQNPKRPYRPLLTALLSLTLSAGGCAKLQVPASDAPMQERVNAYEELRPETLETVRRGYVNYPLLASHTLKNQEPDQYILELANGRRIYNAGKLAPLVLEHSHTAKEANEAKRQNKNRWISIGSATAGALAGAGLVAAGLPLGDRPHRKALTISGAVLSIASYISGYFVARHFRRRANRHSYDAYRTYNRDLQQRLRIRSNPNAYEYEYE